jgi:hypothetical protein
MSAGDRTGPEDDAWIAAIHGTDDDFQPVGSGIVLDHRRVMTCLHVIAGMQEQWVAFPRAQGNAKFIRRRVERVVLPDGHGAVMDGDARDLAILVLSESIPPGVTAAPLCFTEPLKLFRQRWWAFGFPKQDCLGSAADGQVGDMLGYGWLRLHGESLDPIEVGFSGSGVWCHCYGAVVAIVGQSDGTGGGRAVTLHEAAGWFSDEHLRSLADRRAADRVLSCIPDKAPPAPEVAEVAGLLAEHPDPLAVILEVFGQLHAVVPLGATITELLVRLHELVPPNGGATLLQQVRERAAERATGAERAAPTPGANTMDPSADGPCLLVVLRRNGFAFDDFLLSLMLFQDGQPGQPQECDKRSGSLREIQDLLRRLVPRILEATRGGQPMIEFAVPEDLIDTAFDQWPLARRPDRPRAEDHCFGEKYCVVVRDLDRIDPSLSVRDRARWEHRWRRLRASEDSAEGLLHEVYLQKMVGLPKEARFQALAAALRLPEADGKAVLALVPDCELAPGKRKHAVVKRVVAEILKAAFTEGVPAAIWLRHPGARNARATSHGDGVDDRTYLEKVLYQADPGLLRDLPRRVWVLRTQAIAHQLHASHPGRRLSLLWADPGHNWSPHDFRLPPPSSNGADL